MCLFLFLLVFFFFIIIISTDLFCIFRLLTSLIQVSRLSEHFISNANNFVIWIEIYKFFMITSFISNLFSSLTIHIYIFSCVEIFIHDDNNDIDDDVFWWFDLWCFLFLSLYWVKKILRFSISIFVVVFVFACDDVMQKSQK